MSTTVYETSDPELIGKLKESAKRAGRTDWRVYSQELFDQAIKEKLGLAADMTIKEAAAYLGVHPNSIHNYKKAGKFPGAYYYSERRVKLPFAEVLAMKQRTVVVE